MHKARFNVSISINSEFWMIFYNLIPRPTQLSVTCSTEKQGKAGRAWEGRLDFACIIHKEGKDVEIHT